MKPQKRKSKRRRQQADDLKAAEALANETLANEALANDVSSKANQDNVTDPDWDAVAVESTWGRGKRTIASVAIIGYLLLLILGPLSNPVASQNLTAPIAEFVAPVHRALFMGHGYRFFAPNPGDSHIVKYKITREDGTQIEGTFPDRKSMRPRLLYHRWFMLSETVFSEHAQTPSRSEFQNMNEDKKRRVRLLVAGGKRELAEELENERAADEALYDSTLKRIQSLVKSMGKFLLEEHDGQEIELSVATRTIPFPVEVRQGAKLDDDAFLRFPANAVIGRFTISDFSDPIDSIDSDGSEDSKTEESP